MFSYRTELPQHKKTFSKTQKPAYLQKGLDTRVVGGIILTAHSSQLTAHSSQLGVANALINGQLFFTHLLIFPHTLLHAAKAAFCFFIKATAGGIRSCLFCAAALRQRSCNYLDQQSFASNRKHCTVTCRCTRQEEYRILPRMADMNIRYIFIQKEE